MIDARGTERPPRPIVRPRSLDRGDAENESPTMRVASDGTVRLPIIGGLGVLEVATCPRLDLARGIGPRRAFLSPATGRRGPFVAIVEGVPAAVADMFYSHARDELERVSAAPASSLNRAVRAGCAAVRAAARRRPDLDAFGFTAVLFEAAPEPVAFVAQLPPCQLYLVDGSEVRPLPEVPTGQSAGRGRGVSERRWEVEIEALRVPLAHDSRLVLVDASVPSVITDPSRLVDRAYRQVGAMASRLHGLIETREAVIIRYARPVASPTRIARASERVRDFVRTVVDPAILSSKLFGAKEEEGDDETIEALLATQYPDKLEALLQLEASGRVPDPPDRARLRRGEGPARGLLESLDIGTVVPQRISRVVRTSDAESVSGSGELPAWWSGGDPYEPTLPRRRSSRPADEANVGDLRQSATSQIREPSPRPVRKPSGLFGGQSSSPNAPWLVPARGSLVPTSFSGTPLDSARYPRASDPRGWLSRMIGPTVFLPGATRRRRLGWMSAGLGLTATVAVAGIVWVAVQPGGVDGLARRFAAPTPTATPVPPSPTPTVLAGTTVAQAKGRFTSLAAPPNVASAPGAPGRQATAATTVIAVHDDVGEVVTVVLDPLEVTREPIVSPSSGAATPAGFVARGLFASGGAILPRDDGTLLFAANGVVSLLPSGGQPARQLKVKSQNLWNTPIGAVVYGASLYVFDTGATTTGQSPVSRVWRHPLTGGGNYDADAVSWLAPGQTVDLSLASDVATDGAFWVSRRDGSIVRLAGGRAEILELKGQRLPTRLGAIYTDQGTQSIYVVDEEGSRRLIRIGKDGVLGASVDGVLAQGEAARGLWVDEGKAVAVVVTTGRVVVVPIPN